MAYSYEYGKVGTLRMRQGSSDADYFSVFNGRQRVCRRCGFEYYEHQKDHYLVKTRKGWYCKGCLDVDDQ